MVCIEQIERNFLAPDNIVDMLQRFSLIILVLFDRFQPCLANSYSEARREGKEMP
jgi:hypothetical protein